MSIRHILNEFELMSTEWHQGDDLSAVFHHYADGSFHVCMLTEDDGILPWMPRIERKGVSYIALEYSLRTKDELSDCIVSVYGLLDYDREQAEAYIRGFADELA